MSAPRLRFWTEFSSAKNIEQAASIGGYSGKPEAKVVAAVLRNRKPILLIQIDFS